MYLETIKDYENAKANVNTIAAALAAATAADKKKELTKKLEDAQKEVSNLYGKIKAVEVESEFILGQIIQGDDKTRITLSVAPTDTTTFASFNDKGEQVQTNHFGVSSRWFLALTSPICPVSALILDQVPDIRRTIKPTLFSIYTGAKIKVIRKIALKGEKRKVGDGIYQNNQFILDKVVSLDVNFDVKNKFDELRFSMWQQQLSTPYNETAQNPAVNSLFRLS